MQSLAFKQFVFSSVGKKVIIAFSGLFLVMFVVVHLIGNLLLFLGPDAFNLYTYNMTNNKAVLYTLEVIMIVGFLTHIILTSTVTLQNQKARPQRYQKKATLGMSTVFSSNMAITGSYLFIFLIVHLKTFKYGEGEMVDVWGVSGAQVINMYEIVVNSFQNPWYSLFYVVGMIFLGGHVFHGFRSAFQSLGFYDTRLKKVFQIKSVVLGILVGGGFSSIPIYFFLQG